MSIQMLLNEFSQTIKQGELPPVSEFAKRCPADSTSSEFCIAMLECEVAIRVPRQDPDLASDLKQRYTMLSMEQVEQALIDFRSAPTIVQDLEARTIQNVTEDATIAPSPQGNKAAEKVDANEDRTLGDIASGKTDAGTNQATITGVGANSTASDIRRANVDPAKRFGDYELIREIARGGMGVVYQARQLKLNRTCALKMILTGNLAGDQEVQRFYAEAESAANLSHSGIVPVYEVGEIDGQHFFSMGFVEGNSLGQEVADGPLDSKRAARMTRDVAEAIGYAHDHGLIHRDLKPANVLIDRDGTPKVTDFGLAKQIKGDSGLTATGQILGTPSYMPPEQATGNTELVDERSDIYSLGGILYCLLTGHPPFQASTPMDTLIQVMDADPVPPTRSNPLVPKDLETICLKCLAKEKNRRFASAAELVEELDRFLADEPIHSRPIGRVERGWRWCRKRPVIAGLTGTLAMLLVAVAIAGPIIAVQQSQLRSDAEQKRKDAETSEAEANEWAKVATERQEAAESSEQRAIEATEIAEAEREAALHDLYASNISLAHREWNNNNVKHARQLLARCPPELRNWEYYYLQRLVNQESMVMQGLDLCVRIAVDRSRRELVALGISGGQWVTKIYNLRTGTEERSIASAQLISPNGKRYVVLQQDVALVRQVEDNLTIRQFYHEKMGELRGAAFSPDGTLLAIALPDGKADGNNHSDVHVFNVDTGRKVAVLEGAPTAYPFARMAAAPHGFLLAIEISQDNQSLVLGSPFPPGTLQVWDLESKTKTHEFVEHLYAVNSVCLSEDGKQVASAGPDGVNVWHLDRDEVPLKLQGHLGQVYDVTFSPSGESIATAGWDRTARVFSTADGMEIATFRGSQSAIVDLAFDQDGEELIAACRDGDIRVWKAAAIADPSAMLSDEVADRFSFGKELNESVRAGLEAFYASQLNNSEATLAGVHGGAAQCVAVSPDGKLAATAGHDEKVRLWDLSTRSLLHEFDSFVYIHGMQFDPSGEYLAFPNGKLSIGDGDRKVPGRGWVEVRDVATGELAVKLGPIDRPISSVAYSRNGNQIAAACGLHAIYAPQLGVTENRSGQVIVWDVDTEEEVWSRDSHINMAAGVSFSANDQLLATTGMDAVVRIWDAQSGDLLNAMTSALANTCAFSADGKFLAAACTDGVVRVWDANTFELANMMEAHHGNISMVAFSPDGSRLYTAGSDATVTVWDPENGRELLTLQGHTAEVTTVATDQSGRVLASSGADGFLKVWEGVSRDLQGGERFSITLFEDGFARDELGEAWAKSAPMSRIVDGAARTTIQKIPNAALGIDIFIGSLDLTTLKLPDEVEVEFDIWFDDPMGFQVGFSDEMKWHGEFVMSLGAPNPYTGVTNTQALVQGGYVSFKEINSVPYDGLTAGSKHHVVVRRYPDHITLWIDGEEVLSTPARTILNSRLGINSVYGPVDSHCWFDNVTVRTTPSSQLRADARALLDDLFEQHLLPSAVRAELERDASLEKDLVSVALSLVDEYAIDEERLEKRLLALAQEEMLDESELSVGLELANVSQSLDEKDPNRLLMLGFWQLANDLGEEAEVNLLAAEDGFQEQLKLHPGPPALLALCAKKSGSADTMTMFGKAKARFRSRLWQDDLFAARCMQQAIEQIPDATQTESNESDLLVQLLVDAKQAIWIDTDVAPLRELMTENCQVLELRAGVSSDVDRELSRERYLTGSAAMLSTAIKRSLQFSVPDINATEIGYDIGWDTIVVIDNFTMKFREEFSCERDEGQWRITRFKTQMRYRRDGRETIDYIEDAEELAEAVQTARESGDQGELIGRLNQAGYGQEAYELTKQYAAEEPNHYRLFQQANYALFSYNVEEHLAALNQCRELVPSKEVGQIDSLNMAQMKVLVQLERFEELDALMKQLPDYSSFLVRRRLFILREAGQRMLGLPDSNRDQVEEFWNRHLNRWIVESSAERRERVKAWLKQPQCWLLVGPYPSGPDFRGYDKEFPIEQSRSLESLRQLADARASFRVIHELPGNQIDLREQVADQENALVYAYAEVTVDDPTKVQIRFGSDDGAQVFLNGKQIHEQRVHRAWREGRDLIDVTLQSGVNRFLVKVDQAGGEWALSFDICDADGWPLPVQWRDFDKENP